MAYIKVFAGNVFDMPGATTVLYATAADSGYPTFRIYDRNIGRKAQFTMVDPGTNHYHEITVSGGQISIILVNALHIPAPHNLNGASCYVRKGTGGGVVIVHSWTQSDALDIHKEWTGVADANWEVLFSGDGVEHTIGFNELFLGNIHTWTRNPQYPAGNRSLEFNVNNIVSSSGSDVFVEYGPQKRKREYTLKNIDRDMADDFIEWHDTAYAGKRPFYLCDHEGTWIFGKLIDGIGLNETEYGLYEITFNFLEVLP